MAFLCKLGVEELGSLAGPARAAQEIDVVLERGHHAQVLQDVLLGEQGGRYAPASGVGDRVTKQGNRIGDALGVMGQHAMHEAISASAAAVHPAMQRHVVIGVTPECIGAADGVVAVMAYSVTVE